MMSDSHFDVQAWLSAHPPPACTSTVYSQPAVVADWTRTGDTNSTSFSYQDCSGFARLRLRQLPIDLNPPEGAVVPKNPDTKGDVENLIQAALAAGIDIYSKCDIVTYRNNLNKILGLAVDSKSDGWIIDACCVKEKDGNDQQRPVFLEITTTPERSYPDQERLTALGFYFEALCTGESVANPNNEYGVLVRSSLNTNVSNLDGDLNNTKVRLLMGAEIDAYVVPPQEGGVTPASTEALRRPPISTFCELKTYRKPPNGNYNTTYRYRHPKWWIQSFLAGVETMVLGERDDNGIVEQIHQVKTADLVKISWANNCKWYPQQILRFGADMLLWLISVVRGNSEKHVRFEYDGELRRVTYRVLEGGELVQRVLQALELTPPLTEKQDIKRVKLV